MKTVNMMLAIFAICVLASVAVAGSGGQYVLEWSSIDGGGGTSSGGQFTLTGTIGQPDAGYSSGGQFEVDGGFQVGSVLCFVNFTDFAKFAQYWLLSGSDIPADLYQDGTVNTQDLAELAYWWLNACPYAWPLK